jgi:hypothetical protein
VADDDTRYRIVQRRRSPTRDGVTADGDKRTRARRSTSPALPSGLASGTTPSSERLRRPNARLDDEPVVTLPRRFGGNDVVVEDHGDHIAIVLPGALRLVGTRDEAVALAAALLHTVERKR